MLKAKKIAQDELNASLAEQASVLETDTLELRKLETAVANGATYEEAFASSIKNASTAAKEHAIQTKGASGSTDVFVSKQRSAQASLRATATASKTASVAMRALSMAMNMIVIGLITKGLELLGSAISNYIHRVEKANEKIEESRSSYEDAKSSIESMNDELKTTQDKIDDLQSKGTLSFTDKAELDSLKAQNDELERSISLEEKKKQNAASQTVNDIKQNKDTLSDDFEESIKNLSEYQEEYEHMKQVGIKGISDETVTPENYEVTMTAMDKNMNLYEKHVLENIEKFEKYKEDIINKYNTDDVSQFSQSDRDLYNSIVSQLQEAYKTIYSDSDYNKFVIEPIFNQDKLKWLQDQLLQYFVSGGSTDTSALEEKFGADIITALRNACEKAGIDFDKMIEDMYSNSQSKLDQIAPMIETPNGAEDAKQNQVSKKIRDYIQNDLSEEDRTILLNAEIPDDVKFKTKQDVDNFIDSLNKEADSSKETISFKDAWSGLEKGKDELVKLAEAGRLTANDLKGLEGGKTLMEKTGLSAEQLAKKINKLTDSATQLSSMSAQISKMSDMLADKKNGTVASASDLAGFDVSVRGLESWDKFEEVMGSSESSMDQCQKAANALATEWVNNGNFLANLTDENKQYYITQLEDMGVKNAEQIVTEALTKKEEELRFEKLLSADASTDLQNATVADILKLQNLGDITEKERAKLAAFTLEKQYCNKNTIVTDADCQNIYTLAKMAGAGTEALNKLAALKQRLSDNPIMSNEMRNNINNAIQDIVNGVTTSAGAKLDIPQVKVNSSGSSSHKSSSKSPSSKKSKSKSQTKSDAAEVFDFIEVKLNNLTDKASKAKDKIDDLLTFGKKKNQTKKAIEATTTAIKKQEKAYKKYIAYANKAAKTQNSKKTTSSSTSSSTGGNAVYDEATNYLGLKYVWGGASLTSGADCSGFTQQIYKKFGVSLPHHAADQAKMGTKITSKKDLQAGDLVFFGSKNNITHVGIYGGDGKFIESPHTGASVRVSKLSSRKDFVSGSRFSGISGSTTTSGRNVKKVKGVSSKTLEHYKKLIREGTLGSDGIASIKNENLKNALKDYQTYYEKAKACEEQVASLTDQLKDLYETLANNPIDSASDKIEKLGTKMDLLNSKVENAVVNADKKSSITSVNKLYKSIMSNYDSQLNAFEKAYTTAKSNFSSSKKTLTKKFNKYSAKKLGLTSAELKTIKNNLKNNKKIPGSLINKLNKNGYFDLYEKCIAHNEYLDAYNTSIDNVRQAREDNKSNKRQTASDQFDKISGGFDNKLSSIEHIANTAQANLDYAEATGHYATQKYYKDLLKSNQETMNTEQDKMNQLIKKRDEFVKNGQIKKGDDAWQQMSEDIWKCAENIQSCKLNAVEYNNALRDLEWDAFDRQEEYLGRISDEANFLIDLMDSRQKFDDNGNITSYGKSIEGLHAVNANVYQSQADDYEKRIKELDEEYKNDQYNKDYLEKRQSWLESQREAIKNCESEKQAIVSLTKEGYESMSDALDKLIQKRKEALQSERDLYSYQKSITEKTKNLAKLRKQLEAIKGDNSEETKAQIQKLKVSLDDAQTDLRDTEYDKWASDQEELMDKVSEDFKSWIDSRMKQTDDIINDVIKQTNTSGNEIKDTLTSVTGQYGTSLTDKMGEIWDSSNGLNNIVSNMWTGDDGIKNSFTTVNTTLNDIRTYCKNLSERSFNSLNKPSSDDVLKYVEDAFENKNPISTTPTSNSSSGNSGTTTTIKNTKPLTGIPESSSSKTSSSSSKKDSSSSSNASWASKYLIHKKYTGNKSKLNKSSLVDRLKYFNFDSSMSARKKYYKNLFNGAYSGTAAQNNKLIAEMKKHGFKKGGEIGNLVKLTGEDGFVLARKGEGILTHENMETLRESIKMSNATLSMINNLTKTPQIKPSNLNNTVNPTVNIGDIQVVANNPQEFAREFRNTVINDPKTQKMLSTFIGNQLTGGNSLEFKKYK